MLFGKFEQTSNRKNEHITPVAIEDVFPSFFKRLPEKFQYLNNLSYLRQTKITITDDKIALFDKAMENVIGYIQFDKFEREEVDYQKKVNYYDSFYYMYNFGIFHLFAGKSYGSLLIELVNRFLLDNKKNAFLDNDIYLISAVNSSVIELRRKDFQFGKKHFYANHGWEELDSMDVVNNGGYVMAFNGKQDIENFSKFKLFLSDNVKKLMHI